MHQTIVVWVAVLGVLVLNVCGLNEINDIQDYYWRDYTGIIPTDAIPGGTDKSGKRTYIGQMYCHLGMLPATIYEGDKTAVASSGPVIKSDIWIKILCSRNPERYQWIPTKNEESHMITNCHFVIGGTENGCTINIGRVHHDMETIIGKVYGYHTPYGGLYVPDKVNEVRYFSYEILTYNCDLTKYLGNITYVTFN